MKFGLEIMKIKETKMEKNQYNKKDAEDWMIYPQYSEIPQTSYVCANKLVLYPEELFEKLDKSQFDSENFAKIFEQF